MLLQVYLVYNTLLEIGDDNMKRKLILSTILLVALSVSAVFLLSNNNKKQIKKLNTIANKMIVDNLSINYTIPTNEINLNLKNSTQAKDIDAQQYNIIINSIEGKNIIKEEFREYVDPEKMVGEL